MFKPKPKEKGQGLIEYALILVLIAIFVIFCVLIVSTIDDGSSNSQTSNSVLSNTPVIGISETNPQYISLSDEDRDKYKNVEYGYGCYKKSIDSAYSIRAGTEYADASVIRIKRLDDNTYSFCVDVKGAKVKIIYDLVKNPQ